MRSLKWGRTGNDIEAKDVAEMPVVAIPENVKSPQPHQQLATQFVGVNIFSPQDTRVGKTKRDQSALDIVTTCFDQLPDSSSRGRLMQALLRNVVGQSEFDKIRVGRAMVDSLQNFEERCKSDPRINYRTSELVLGAHTATLPSPELKLGREYERITLFDRHLHKKARSVIASKVEYHTETGLFAQKPRGLAKTTELRKSFITAFWRSRCSPRMLGSGSISKVI